MHCRTPESGGSTIFPLEAEYGVVALGKPRGMGTYHASPEPPGLCSLSIYPLPNERPLQGRRSPEFPGECHLACITPRRGEQDHELFLNTLTNTLPQGALSQQNGVCIPQRRYGKGAGRDLLDNQRLVLFNREDGSYIPVPAAVAGNYVGLVCRDLPAFGEAGFTITIRFEVNGSSHPRWYTGTYLLRSGSGIHPRISR